NSAVPTLLARGSRLAFRATMCRAEGDLEARWNRILTIFDPYTFSHSQGQSRTRGDLPSSIVFWSAAPSTTDATCCIAEDARLVPMLTIGGAARTRCQKPDISVMVGKNAIA